MPNQSSQFTLSRVTDYSGTKQDLSTYVQDLPVTGPDADATDVTTFAASGGRVTHGIIRGALKSEPTLTFLFNPTLVGILEPLLGNNTGYLWEFAEGNGAAPTFGDDWLGASYVLLNMHFDYSSANPTTPATIKCDLKLVDGGATLPTWNKYGV